MRKFSDPELQVIIAAYLAGQSMTAIAKQWGVMHPRIRWVLRKNAIPLRYVPAKIRRPDIKTEELIELYRRGLSVPKIANRVRWTESGVYQRLVKTGFVRRSRSESLRRYEVDHHFFDHLSTHNQAYIYGFIAADGCIHVNTTTNSRALRIKIHRRDIGHLQRIKTAMRSTHPIKVSEGCVMISIASPQLCDSLINRGIVPNKSLLLTSEITRDIPPNLIASFILGLFDGDGTISLRDNGAAEFGIVGTRSLMTWVHKQFVNHADLPSNRVILCGRVAKIHWGGWHVVYNAMQWLYGNHRGIFLERKYHIFNKILLNSLDKLAAR